MTTDSINAYDLPERVISYDVDMELMHPRRTKMIDIALELLATGTGTPVKALDLGAGTGYFTYRFLSNYPDAFLRSFCLPGGAFCRERNNDGFQSLCREESTRQWTFCVNLTRNRLNCHGL